MSQRTNPLDQARAAVARGDFPAAHQTYEMLLAQHSGAPDVLVEYGRAKYLEHEDLDSTATLFEQAVQASKQATVPLLWLADVYSLGYGRGYPAAADIYRQIIRVNPTPHGPDIPHLVDAYIGLGLLHRAPDSTVTLEEAIACFRQAAGLDPRRPDALTNLANALIQAGQPQEARQHLQRARDLLRQQSQDRQAQAVEQLLTRLDTNQPITAYAYTSQSSRYV